MMINRCLFCGGNANTPEHFNYCDGRQGARESQILEPAPVAEFDGATYEPDRDHDRLHAQLTRVLNVVRDHDWHTLSDIATRTGDPEASISARLRDLRKLKFGGHVVARRYVDRGLFEYRLDDAL